MASVLIRGLSELAVDALKRRARLHHRSLQRELHAIVEDAITHLPPDEGSTLDLNYSRSEYAGPWLREAVYDDRGR